MTKKITGNFTEFQMMMILFQMCNLKKKHPSNVADIDSWKLILHYYCYSNSLFLLVCIHRRVHRYHSSSTARFDITYESIFARVVLIRIQHEDLYVTPKDTASNYYCV